MYWPSCRSPLGLRGLKLNTAAACKSAARGRSPLGLRGLKCEGLIAAMLHLGSQPSWAAWIEIGVHGTAYWTEPGRSPLGLRGLKYTALGYMRICE